jgi:hypothetical protein
VVWEMNIFLGIVGGAPDCCKILIVMFLYRMIVFKTSGKLIMG